jgi:hypothetical protein
MTPHRICKCGWRFFTSADVKCPRCDTQKQGRQAKIAEALAQQARLIAWLSTQRQQGEAGAGDTASRLLASDSTATDARRELERLLTKCSCSRGDAVERLNREHAW